jgi:type VI secretion system protein ImpG
LEEPAPVASAYCLTKPTPTAYPPLEGATLWALVSNLSVNHLSLSGGPESLEALKEMLSIYGVPERESTEQQIAGIMEMSCRRVVRRVGTEAWRGFCQGTEVTLVLDEDRFVGGGAVLLGAVLWQFFGLYSSVNSFVELVLRKYHQNTEWKRWAPLTGSLQML